MASKLISVKTIKKPKKINKKKVEKMSDEFLPTTGYQYYKQVKKVKEEYVISYIVKGDSDILTFIKNRFYDGISAISSDIKFETVQFQQSTNSVIVVDDSNKYPNIKNDVYQFNAQPPIIFLDMVLDNLLEIKISFSKNYADIFDSHFLFVVEYLLKAFDDNKELLQNIVEKGKKLFTSDDIVDNIISDEEKVTFFNDEIYITNEDKEKLRAQNEEKSEK
jgi:hypothetical protein